MYSFGSKLKLLGTISQPRCRIRCGQERRYLSRPGDDDIKWQWSVRESPCQQCKPYARPGLLARLLRRKQVAELTNRHQEVKYQPKLWELEYYSYLLPDCEAKAKEAGRVKKPPKTPGAGTYSACAAKDFGCEGKRTFVHLKTDSDSDLKPQTEKLAFSTDPPFCLNEVCGKVKPPKKDTADVDNTSFKCLNDLVECKDKDEEKDGKDCK